MRLRLTRKISLLVYICFTLLTFSCGSRYTIQGKVLDAETGKPIEGAAVAIRWYKYTPGPPLSSGYKGIETAEDLSDINGTFKLPKYAFKQYYMGAYKKGYVCWDSEHIFHPLGKSYEERIEKRKSHKVYDGMVIKLEPFKREYPLDKHATFTTNVGTRLSITKKGLFGRAIDSEYQLDLKNLRKNSGRE